MEYFSQYLADKGLNLQAVVELSNLPPEVYGSLANFSDLSRYSQLLLVGHGGKLFWQQLQKYFSGNDISLCQDPVDQYSAALIDEFFATDYPDLCYSIIYPADKPVGLQKLGEFVGWHFPSPFMVGINSCWGTWFAYRAVVLARSKFQITPKAPLNSPCTECADKPCYGACPAGAVSIQGFSMKTCLDFRLQQRSPCQKRCLARIACPANSEHQYSDNQLNYHYSCSFKTIKELRLEKGG